MKPKNIDKLVQEAFEIEAEDARQAGAVGYMARALVQATLPHRKLDDMYFERRNGLFKLTIMAPPDIGLPFGNIPRLLVAWLTTEAVRTKQREVFLGQSLREFMRQLDFTSSGGKQGSIGRMKEQMKRLFSASISCTYDNGKNWAIKHVQPVSEASLWWDPNLQDTQNEFQSVIKLGESFYKEAITSPIPINMQALKGLKYSSLALDIYCWLTYRFSYLRHKAEIPWEILQLQFGSSYAHNNQGLRNFKKAFLQELKCVLTFYPQAVVNTTQSSIILYPSKTHIKSVGK